MRGRAATRSCSATTRGYFGSSRAMAARKGVAHARHELKERQIRIGQLRTDQVARAGRIALQHPFEIADIFRRSRFQKVSGAGLRFLALVFVIEAAGYRMMGVVSLVHKIGDRQLQLMGPQPARLVRRRQAVVIAEIEQDVGGLTDDQIPGFQERRRERQMPGVLRRRAGASSHPRRPLASRHRHIRRPPPPAPIGQTRRVLVSRPNNRIHTACRRLLLPG